MGDITVRRVLILLLLAIGPTPEGGFLRTDMNYLDASRRPGGNHDEYEHSVRAEISRAMVSLYKEQFGRGPTKARTDFAGPDAIVCTLENSLTQAEQALAEMGEHQRLRDTRLYFQHASEEKFRGVVEHILGRKVRAFVSGIDTVEDVSSEMFYLEPAE